MRRELEGGGLAVLPGSRRVLYQTVCSPFIARGPELSASGLILPYLYRTVPPVYIALPFIHFYWDLNRNQQPLESEWEIAGEIPLLSQVSHSASQVP